jgi:hypothetical protein
VPRIVKHMQINPSSKPWTLTQFRIVPFIMNETVKGNLIHLGLILVTLLIALVSPSSRSLLTLLYVCGIVAAFCAVFGWQPWNTRLHLPLFVLFSPAIGTVFERRWQGSVTTRLAIALLVLSSPVALMNTNRPLIGEGNVMSVTRDRLYFREHPTLLEPYREAAKRINATYCRSIGLDIPWNEIRYPLLVLRAQSAATKT